MRIILIRHGQTFHNLYGIAQGQFDSILTDQGRKQAEKTANLLKRGSFNPIRIISSDLSRAVDTCDPILKLFPELKLEVTRELRELDIGIYESQYKEKINEERTKNGEFMNPEGGEVYNQSKERITSFYNSIIDKQIDGDILVVTHRGVILELLNNLGYEIKRGEIKNTDVFSIEITEANEVKVEKVSFKNEKEGKDLETKIPRS
jgi:broad specificity phosphatase PhoE